MISKKTQNSEFIPKMMRINEKVLAKYASSSNAEIDKEGYLLKKSESRNEFQKRYCILKGNLFYYFEKPTSEPLGCLVSIKK